MTTSEAWRAMLAADQYVFELRDDLDAGPELVDAERAARLAHEDFDEALASVTEVADRLVA